VPARAAATPAGLPPKKRSTRRESKKAKAERAQEIARRFAEVYPAECALVHDNPFQLLTATILSAQTTDERVNMVTPALFARYPTPADLAVADPGEVAELIHSTGFYQNKTKSIIGMAQALEERFDGEVPTALEDLVTIPGVGRKTGNVVRSVDFDLPGLPVDTHVARISNLLGLTTNSDPVKIELDLNALLPPPEWGGFSLRTILHGRRVCIARRPRCDECVLVDLCPSARPTLPVTSSPAP
jgi:endonuclease-3